MTIRKHFLIATLPFITITLFLVGILTEREYKTLTINTASHFADTIVSQTSILVSTRCSEYEDSLLNDILNWKLFDNYLNTSKSTQIKHLEVRSFTNTRNCIFRKNCASVPEERSAIPLQTEQSSAG